MLYTPHIVFDMSHGKKSLLIIVYYEGLSMSSRGIILACDDTKCLNNLSKNNDVFHEYFSKTTTGGSDKNKYITEGFENENLEREKRSNCV